MSEISWRNQQNPVENYKILSGIKWQKLINLCKAKQRRELFQVSKSLTLLVCFLFISKFCDSRALIDPWKFVIQGLCSWTTHRQTRRLQYINTKRRNPNLNHTNQPTIKEFRERERDRERDWVYLRERTWSKVMAWTSEYKRETDQRRMMAAPSLRVYVYRFIIIIIKRA